MRLLLAGAGVWGAPALEDTPPFTGEETILASAAFTSAEDDWGSSKTKSWSEMLIMSPVCSSYRPDPDGAGSA